MGMAEAMSEFEKGYLLMHEQVRQGLVCQRGRGWGRRDFLYGGYSGGFFLEGRIPFKAGREHGLSKNFPRYVFFVILL